MSIFENIVYGFLSGITEFLPVSSRAHQTLLRYILGEDSRNFLQEFLVHIGLLLSVIIGCREFLSCLRREQRAISATRYKKRRSTDPKSYYDIRLLKTAAFPLVIGLFLSFVSFRSGNHLMPIIGFLILNGIVLLIADHTQHGNRDSRTMTGLDGFVMGVLGALSVFPGISRTGMISAYAALRGADFENVINWTLALGIPAIIFWVCFDILGLITIGAGAISFALFIGYVLAGVSAFFGGYIAISVLKAMLNHAGFSQFAYYSFGVAFLTFIIYLIT